MPPTRLKLKVPFNNVFIYFFVLVTFIYPLVDYIFMREDKIFQKKIKILKKVHVLFIVATLFFISIVVNANILEKTPILKNTNKIIKTDFSENSRKTCSDCYWQPPYEPDESWIFRISDSSLGYRVWDDFWDLEYCPIICIRWWGLGLIDYDNWTSCDPDGMVFEIIFWDSLLGNPVCSYQVTPKAKGTFKFYNESKMFYWSVKLSPSLELQEGWVSIQSIQSPNQCYFLWAGSKYGNLNCYQEGATNPDCDGDCAFEIAGEGCYMWVWDPKIQCDSVGMNFGGRSPGVTVVGQIYVCNVGEYYTWMEWFVDTVSAPSWGTWTFSPASGKGVREDDCVLVQVTCKLTENPGSYYGTIIVYNAEDSTDFCIIDTSVIVPRTRASSYLWYEWLLERFPLLERLLGGIR
jgi:hypothetical protein